MQANSLTIKKDLWEIAIKEAYKKNELAKILLKKPSANENVRIKNGFILLVHTGGDHRSAEEGYSRCRQWMIILSSR